MKVGDADECLDAPLGPRDEDSKELLEGALAVLNALAATSGRSKDEQIDALRAAVRFAEDNDCSDVTDRAFAIDTVRRFMMVLLRASVLARIRFKFRDDRPP